MNTPHQCHAAVVVNGKIYVVGGFWMDNFEFEEYNPETDKWRILPNMPTRRLFLGATTLQNRIYAIGGMSDSVEYHSTIEAYDLTNNTWSKFADLPTARNRLATVALSGKIYAIGGMMPVETNYQGIPERNYQDTGIVEVYDQAENLWTTKEGMPTPRHGHSAVVVNNKILVIGGFQLEGSWPTATVEEYDPIEDKWTQKAALPTPRGFLGAAVVKGYIYAIGGRGRGAPVERYDSEADEWERIGTMPEWRNRFAIAVVDDIIYVIGGEETGDPQIPLSVLRYEPPR
ncbi:MAG: hypothetical protein GWN00_27625 [Aliifodinibius sp.]|nr:hypothetical protein [Fodinibius sp.]NIY28438.1 hypothetical protein [Fodinibius sp.]